jgi:crotonobetainyl-CoA:carnitine CoA-transferase CaiB-like acyl-CoA transferase
MERLLETLTVVEASRGVAVRYCGRLFAQLGATVVRAPGGDDTRIGYAGAAGESFGRWLDAGKAGQAGERGVDLVLAGQDAEGVAQGEAAAASLAGAPALLALRWFHPDGPYADWRGTDEAVQALAGMAYSFGPAAGPPTLAQGHGPQVAAGLAAFNAALGALMARPRPRRIDVNIFEAYACLVETGAVSALMEGGVAVRLGVNRLVPTYPCSSYATSDGWAGVSALTPAQWAALCQMVGRPELAGEPRFATAVERLMLADEVDRLIAPAFRERATADWVALGEAARVPITAMPDLAALPGTPHWTARGAFATFDGSGIVAPTLPYRMRFRGPGRPVTTNGPEAPLRGLRVIDFSMGWAGPLCARTLADLGADVVKVESAEHPDWWRGWERDQSGDPPPRETKFSFICMNRNKRGVVLDLGSEQGLAQARALIASADVMVENFAAGVMERLGLGAGVRGRLNPGLITVSMPAFGNGGPLSGIRAYGSTVEQASGLPFANGRDAWPPALQHVAFGDPLAGLTAANAVLAALFARERFGGAEIDLAQVASLFQFAADAIIAQQFVPGPLPRTGSRRTRAAACVVGCRSHDSWLAVSVDSEAAFEGLRALLGRPDLSAEGDAFEAALSDWAASRTPEDAAAELQAAGVSAAPVQRTDQLCYDPQLMAGGFWLESERRHVGAHLIPAAPFAYDGVRPAIRRPAPTLGQHTDEVLRELGEAVDG